MNFKSLAKAKHNTLQIYATPEKYDMYKRTISVVSELYLNDFTVYSDSIEQRHERNKRQIKKILELIRSNKMLPQMLQYNTTNSFYPSYVMNHHYNQFLKLSTCLAQYSQPLRQLLPDLKNGQIIGGIFEKTIHKQFGKQLKPTLQNGLIKMNQYCYFYSFKTSPYLHLCCFNVKYSNKNLFVFVRIRNQYGQILDGIQVRDMGATLANDYTIVGYRFNNVRPLFAIQANYNLYRGIISESSVTQLGYSLYDLAHSLYVTVRYTTMRTQFSTLQKSNKQRQIIQYQAVSSRIVDGYSTLFALSFLRQRLILMPEISVFMRFYLPFIHQVILQKLIQLRQCCGGFGFMQVSGHPGYMERVSIRAAQHALTSIPDNKQILKRLHYYSSDVDRMQQYKKQITKHGNTLQDIFIYFLLICMGMNKNKQLLNQGQYMKEFFKQAGIQLIYSATYYDNVDPTNPSQGILTYIMLKYVIQYFKYIPPNSLKLQPQKLHQILINKQKQLLLHITDNIPKLTSILEVGFLRNVIVGQDNANLFYEQLMDASEKNKRNSPQYANYILKPLVQVIKGQRAKL